MIDKFKASAVSSCGVTLALACAVVVFGTPRLAWADGTAHLSRAPAAATAGYGPLRPVVRVKPRYPPGAQYRGYEGTVRVCFTVTAQGTVTDIRRVGYHSLAAPASTVAPASATARVAEARTLLGAAAVATIRKWRFTPRKKNGKAIATPDVCQEIAFNIFRHVGRGQIKVVQKAAAAGSASAQLRLSNYYANGVGVKKDPAMAVKWMRKSAEQGNASAEALLGIQYLPGGLATLNVAKGVGWIRKSATQGNVIGEWVLGMLYQGGKAVPRDPALAAHWYRKAAQQGNPEAATALGYLYALGKGVRKDCQLAFYWFFKAKSEDSMQARKALRIYARKGSACYVHPM